MPAADSRETDRATDRTTDRDAEDATLAALEDEVGRGLDALDAPSETRAPWWRRAATSVVPPILAAVLFIVVWQLIWASALLPEYKLPSPGTVFGIIGHDLVDGQALSIIWTSVSRAVLGFALAVVIATPIGLLVSAVPVVRSAIGPALTGLQSLPSVAWVPAGVLWFGLTDTTIYFVILMGAVPSIANGLVSGIDQVPPLLPRVGHAMGAGRLQTATLILLPASLPGFLAGLKQGWAFAWRSLMAAEIIATAPSLGFGLGAYLDLGQANSEMYTVMAAIILILIVGVGIELLVFRPAERRVLRARGLATTT